jgi:uracil-DNA glycosylase family 4
VLDLARSARSLAELEARVSVCRACPRLVRWREEVAVQKRRAFADEPYWGRPVPGWGSERPEVVVVGLAPAAHGGNRTGRIFTGDRSGDWLFAALFRAGLATRETSRHAGDGQRLVRTRMVAVVRCAPPANKPAPDERDTCRPWLDAELQGVLASTRAIVCLGSFAWDATCLALRAIGCTVPVPRPRFGHGARALVVDPYARELALLGSYHPSQQNTFTGKLTAGMLDDVVRAARDA